MNKPRNGFTMNQPMMVHFMRFDIKTGKTELVIRETGLTIVEDYKYRMAHIVKRMERTGKQIKARARAKMGAVSRMINFLRNKLSY